MAKKIIIPDPEKEDKSLFEHKKQALATAIAAVQKKFGKESIQRVGDKPRTRIPAISTGVPSLDVAIGIGGVPKGRIIEIYGPESGGKTTMSLSTIAECQRAGGVAAFIDAEHALDLDYAATLGVDVDNLLLMQPGSGEEALQTAEELALSNAVDIIVIDSVSALIPRAEVEGEIGDPSMGLQARMMSQALRKLSGVVSRSGTTLIFINQLRMKIGVMFGNPETTSGGNALKFYASVRLDVRRVESIKQGDLIVGNRVRVKVVKNKVAAPFKQAVMDFIFGKGIDKLKDIVEIGVEKGIIQKSGSWYSYKEERLGQGIDGVAQLLAKDNVFYQSIRAEVMATLTLPVAVEEEPAVDAD